MKNKKLQFKQIVLICLLAIVCMHCSDRPSGVLSSQKMENFLYDLYVAEGEINTDPGLFSRDSLRRQKLLDSVLEKHRISEADLDSSIQWYNANLAEYQKINTNLSLRYKNEIEQLRQKDAQNQTAIRIEGQIELPVSRDSLPYLNILTLPEKRYDFQSDTLMNRYGGIYEVQFNILGIDDLAELPELTFSVECSDTTFLKKTIIEQDGFFTDIIQIPYGKKFEKISGYIRFPELFPQTILFLSDFQLFLYTGVRPERKSAVPSMIKSH